MILICLLLIDKYVPSELEKRRKRLIDQFDQDIEYIKEKIKPQILESEEYLTILFKVFKNAIEEHEQMKIKLFRAILQNSAIDNNITSPEIELFIKFVSELTISHIRIFKYIHKGSFVDIVHYIHPTEDIELQNLCVQDLKQLNLIRDTESNGLVKNRALSYTLSNLGKRFYNFIELQEDNIKDGTKD